MDTARSLFPGKATPSLVDHFAGRKGVVRPDALPSARRGDCWGTAPEWPENTRLTLQKSSSAKAERLPHIILLSGGGEPMSVLGRVLDSSPLEIRRLTTCPEAVQELVGRRVASVIFTDVRLPDGDWRQVLHLARHASVPIEVILVSRIVDVRLYLDALEAGAFDFVVPPFSAADLDYIIVNAFYSCLKQRPIEPLLNLENTRVVNTSPAGNSRCLEGAKPAGLGGC